MEPIIAPIDKALLRQELTRKLFLRKTNRGDNEIYIFTAQEAPNAMREVGRLREVSFRTSGGGSGKACDIDEFDTCENGYKQLIVWNPEMEEIVGGYRYIHGADVIKHPWGTNVLATSHMFNYSDKFVKEILPYTIELGRSFVAPTFQSTGLSAQTIFSLDNLWDGLGGLTVIHPDIKYFFGKVTMYADYNHRARNLILFFMDKYFHDDSNLVTPKEPVSVDGNIEEIKQALCGKDLHEDYRLLKKEVRKLDINIPPLFSAYISLSPTLLLLGTAVNYEFSNVEETGILIRIDEILDEKKLRHIESFRKQLAEQQKE